MCSKEKKRIALAGLICEESQGDHLLIDCTRFLLTRQSPFEIEFTNVDFFGSDMFAKSKNRGGNSPKQYAADKKSFISNLKDSYNKCVLASDCNFLKNRIYNKQYKRFLNSPGTTVFMRQYFDERLRDVDMIVVIGGGTVKYDIRVDFGRYYRRILDYAREKMIPIVVLGVGIESKFNKKDARCSFFSETLSDDIFKLISTRDEIDELKKYVTNPSTELSKIADIGVWSADVFGIKKNEMADKIGIGVIVADRFSEFRTGITPQQYDRVLVEVINKLKARGENVEIFNNGDSQDEAYAKHISELAGMNKDDVRTAGTPMDILKIESNYKGIISSRLHSVIPAYSLDIPFVAIAWNNKLRYFAENIGVSERVIQSDRMDSDTIIQAFDKAIVEGYDAEFRQSYKKTDLDFVDKCFQIII